ncbi:MULTISPECIES: hypothetical protein [unclassified Saccharopolyspora]|uniref:hypothetical protein n=1 Tax=Saccharopolyspora TaxID=1835 RepID=UPI001F335CFB|nr:hypothetical protein [Saccharopolyspora sp. HNM0986]
MRTSRWVATGFLLVCTAGMLGATTPAGAGGEITVTGKVQSGVESRCMVLPAQGRSPYLLLGGDPAVVKPGAHLVVRGHPEPGAPTTCMQGTPLHVSEAHPA